MKKLLISCSLGLGILLTSMSANAGWHIDWPGDALFSGGHVSFTIDCGYPTLNTCYRMHFDAHRLKRIEVFVGPMSQTIELPPGSTLNNIPVEQINGNTNLGPVVNIVVPN